MRRQSTRAKVETGKETKTRALYTEYDNIIAMLVNMQNHPDDWSITKR